MWCAAGIDLLECQLAHALGIDKHQPVRIVRCAVGGRFVAGAVLQPQQRPVELREPPGTGGIDDGMKQPGVFRHAPPSRGPGSLFLAQTATSLRRQRTIAHA